MSSKKDAKGLLLDELNARREEVRKAEEILKEQVPVIRTLERILGKLDSPQRAKADLSWTEVALEILSVEVKKNTLFAELRSRGFTVTSSSLGVWLHRQKEKGVLVSPRHGRYKLKDSSDL